MHLACCKCRRRLTQDGRFGDARDHEVAGDRAPSVPRGVMVRLEEESSSPIYGAGGQIGAHVWSRAGAIVVHPDDVERDSIVSAGVDNGCCDSDGGDGLNRACLCGQRVATEWSDCWTQAELRFDPDAIMVIEA